MSSLSLHIGLKRESLQPLQIVTSAIGEESKHVHVVLYMYMYMYIVCVQGANGGVCLCRY